MAECSYKETQWIHTLDYTVYTEFGLTYTRVTSIKHTVKTSGR